MDNQQRRIEERLSWLGGIIDADGAVTVTRRSNNCYKPIVMVINTDLRMVNEVISVLEAVNVPHYVHSRKSKVNPKHKIRYDISIVGMKRCVIALPLLIPYLVVKKRRAERLLEFCNGRLSKSINSYDEDDINLVNLIRRH